jgi:hypothetical protein
MAIRQRISAEPSEKLYSVVALSLDLNGASDAPRGDLEAAAWAQTGFAGFRLVTMYLAERMWAEDLAEGGFRDEERGANLWLAVPNDEGVFDGRALHQGMPCVHPVQVYLDLKAQPERSADAAEELRMRRLPWSTP